MIQKYLNIISNYRKMRLEKPDTWISYCEMQPDLLSAIRVAALAENNHLKRHPHQYRLQKVKMQAFLENLVENSNAIGKAQYFDDLYNIVDRCKVKGVARLAVYDTANRIGRYLGLNPQFIYLHAGTRKGVEKLIGKVVDSKISKDQLPEPFKSSNLSAAELEDIMCIYKQFL